MQSSRSCGGLTGTALVAASRLGARCAYAGTLGDDALSKYCMRQFRREGVSLHGLRNYSGISPIYSTIVVGEVDATRNIFYNLTCFEAAPQDWPSERVLDGLRVLFVDNFHIAAQTRLATLARELRIPVVADFEDCEAEGFDRLMQLCDHLILSSNFASRITAYFDPQDAVRALWREDRVMVAVTCGANGCYFAMRDANASRPNVRHMPAFTVEAVDTTGCGDVFHGAYATGLVQGQDIPGCLRFASAAAALKATRPGGQTGAPTIAELKQFLEEHDGKGIIDTGD